MHQRVKKLWIEDLRANVDKQGRGRLTRVTEKGVENDCCLGRLRKLALTDGVSINARERIDGTCTLRWGTACSYLKAS